MSELFAPIGDKVEKSTPVADGEDDERIVEEIESMCMNCHENVSNNTDTASLLRIASQLTLAIFS